MNRTAPLITAISNSRIGAITGITGTADSTDQPGSIYLRENSRRSLRPLAHSFHLYDHLPSADHRVGLIAPCPSASEPPLFSGVVTLTKARFCSEIYTAGFPWFCSAGFFKTTSLEQ